MSTACQRSSWSLIGALSLVCACGPLTGWAETPGEIPKPWTYEGSTKLQQQHDQQQQQQDQPYQDAQRQVQAQQHAAAAQGRAVLQAWQKRPPLSPEHNPLLGRWNSQGSSAAAAKKLSGGNQFAGLLGPEMANMTNALLGGITGGMCASMLGRGLIEFRPTTLVAIGRDGSEHVKYHVEYRGGGARVVVLPRDAASFTHMIVDFDNPDHVTVAAVGCVMVRSGSAAAAAVAARPGAEANGGAGAAVLALTAGATERPGQFTPVVGRDVWVLKGSADTALIRGGLQSSPDGSVMHNFMLACQRHSSDCQKGMNAIRASAVSVVKTDAAGHARTAALPAGRYYVFGALVVNQRPMVWQQPIDLRSGSNALALDVANAYPVD